MLNKYDVLHSPFDAKAHKLCFNDYLEVMLAPDGTIHYAVPSHQEFLINKVCEIRGWSRVVLMYACPPEYYFNFLDWLISESGGYIPVWERFVYSWPLNKLQVEALKMLRDEKLYRGKVPKESGVSQ